ncbi:MAG: hypothetical protein AABW72_04665 [archaeon]
MPLEYLVEFTPISEGQFKKLPKCIKKRILKKIIKLKQEICYRHLNRNTCFVAEVGQYRIAFLKDDIILIKTITFIGNHKQYEKWLGLRK